jgi:hypothetical protein
MRFDDEFAGPCEYARMYRDIGWQAVPSLAPSEDRAWKRPAIKWREHLNELATDEVFDGWYGERGGHRDRGNMGLITGKCSGNITVVDLDLQKFPQALDWWQTLLEDHNGGFPLQAPTQRTGGGGLQVFVYWPDDLTPPTGKTSIGVDIRGQGGFAVMPPSLHESGRNYAWLAGLEPWNISAPLAGDWLIEAVEEVLAQYGGSTRDGPRAATDSPDTAVNAFGAIVDGREDYMAKLVWAKVTDLKRAHTTLTTIQSEQMMLDAFKQYSATVKSRLFEVGISNEDLLEREGRGLSDFRKKWQVAMGKWATEVAEAADAPKPKAGALPQAKAFEVAEGDDGIERPVFEPFPLMSIPQIRTMPDPKFLIEGMIIENSLGFVFGSPGCCKTFIALGMALSIAAGLTEWWGRKVYKNGPVIYISSEGVSDLKFRIAAWERETGISVDDISFYLIHVPINFMEDADIERLIMTVQYSDLVAGEKPAAMFVDTVSRALPGADENLQKDMTLFVGACDRVRQAFDCTMVGIHHTNKAGGIRGSTVLNGAADFVFEVSREEGAAVGEIKARKIKAAADGWTIAFKTKEVALGDIAGHTSLFVEPASKEELSPAYELPSKFKCQEMLDAMAAAWADGKPWSNQPNTRRDGRYAPMLMARWEVAEDAASSLISSWILNGIIEIDFCDRHSKVKGIRVVGSLYG